MLALSHFRIYLCAGSDTLIEDVEAEGLADAVDLAESRRSEARYFEIWQGENLLATSQDHRPHAA